MLISVGRIMNHLVRIAYQTNQAQRIPERPLSILNVSKSMKLGSTVLPQKLDGERNTPGDEPEPENNGEEIIEGRSASDRNNGERVLRDREI